jgi:hypothetical protein
MSPTSQQDPRFTEFMLSVSVSQSPFLVCHFYTTLNLEVGRHYVITWLLSPMG